MSSRCPERGRRHGPPPARRAAALRLATLALAAAALSGCEREARRLQSPPSAPLAPSADVASLRPGPAAAAAPAEAAASGADLETAGVEENAYAVSQGKRWFRWFNCSGCHAAGGGDMGPPLSDDRWLYGHRLPQVAASILEGRPNGMPAYASRLSSEQAWQLAAYVRSLSGQLRSDVAGSRGDAMRTGEPEQRREQEPARPDPAASGAR